ncbi:hypothetical protein PIB30_083286 [Stylosanthes scabra]|uniref:Uncharacterized protein n=1 Tax=Stylosanthes scabra TaxID=79078 RepID=A0ABU6ZQW7_9FABA|nr:hypothetical protein [Stylosanthes scabra]
MGFEKTGHKNSILFLKIAYAALQWCVRNPPIITKTFSILSQCCVRNFRKSLDKELILRGCVCNSALTPKLRTQQRPKGPLRMIKRADSFYPFSFSLLLPFKHSHTLFLPKPIFFYLHYHHHPSSSPPRKGESHGATNPSLTKTRYPKSSTISTIKDKDTTIAGLTQLAALKDSPLLPSPTSVIVPKKLLVLALAAPMTTPPSVVTVSKNPIAPILETLQPCKIKRTARMSVKPIRRRFSQRIIARGGPSQPVITERIIIDDSSDSEINKNVEDDVKEQNAMDEPLVPEEEEVPEEERRFWDYDDLDDWGTAEPADSSKESCTEHPSPNP